MIRKIRILAALLLALGLALLGLSLSAGAATPTSTTTVVNWVTTADPTHALPTDASNVPWPQSLLKTGDLPPCAKMGPIVIQRDTYVTTTQKQADDLAALLASGTLGLVNGTPQDSEFVTSWVFVLLPQCVDTPSPVADAHVTCDSYLITAASWTGDANTVTYQLDGGTPVAVGFGASVTIDSGASNAASLAGRDHTLLVHFGGTSTFDFGLSTEDCAPIVVGPTCENGLPIGTIVQGDCATPTDEPTPTDTPTTDQPTPSDTPTTASAEPTPSTDSPSSTPSSSDAPVGSATPVALGDSSSSAPIATVEAAQLASTGNRSRTLTGIGVSVLLLGLIMLVAAKPHRRH